MVRPLDLVRLLADGETHSGEAIAERLGVSRAAVWKVARKVRDGLGLPIESVRGAGYRLTTPLELLDPAMILSGLGGSDQARIAHLEIHDRIDSTNARLLARAREGLPSGSACLAEIQTAGRGRRGRQWVSPFAANLYLSILLHYPFAAAALGGLSLAMGVAAARVLRDTGLGEVALKWPNDILWRDRKLGGLLLEMAGDTQGPCHVVVGLGLNLRMPSGAGRDIDQPWVDLAGALDAEGHPVAMPGRNALAGRLLASLTAALERFGNSGLEPFLADWAELDALRGRRVGLHQGGRVILGDHDGVDSDGALRLRTAGGVERFHGGEVSLRLAEDSPA